jgi:hypothetical protein
MKQSKNVFSKGVVSGIDVLSHPKDSLWDAVNAEFVSSDGNLFAITNSKGFKLSGSITSGYIPVVAKSIKGIAYIFSIQLNGNIPTGRAEIGCYPSPDWESTTEKLLLDKYSPLMNYQGDNLFYPFFDGPFRSSLFNVKSDADYEIELQNDYDGSVNLILNDAKNPTLIINSGFKTVPGNKAVRVNRAGKATNRYGPENFDNTLKLILNSSRIMNVKFAGVNNGGQLQAGHYRYFFYYMTNDGTLTQMVNESMDVHVFNGNSPADTVGDRAKGDKTTKFVAFQLKNLDDSFPFIKVFYTYSFGETEAFSVTFELTNPVRFQDNSTRFTHTGFEPVNGTSPDFLNKRIGSIESVGSIAQVQGRLFAAKIKEKGRNLSLFRSFAARTSIGSRQIKMEIFGTQKNLSTVSAGSTGPNEVADAYAGGYYNPYNIYHYTGYFGNETTPFALVFIYKDGSVTPAFPVLGVDNSSGSNDSLLQTVGRWQIDLMIKEGGYLNGDQNLINTNGIYRFPKRENSTGITLDQINPGLAKVNGVTFKLPDINDPEYALIKAETIGFYLVRGERRPDLLSQGYLIDTINIPAIDVGNPNEPFQSIARFRGGYSEITSKFVPAFDFTLEAVKAYETYKDKGERLRSNYKGKGGIHPFKFNFKGRDFSFREKFAFISAEVILDKDKSLQVLSSKDIEIHLLGKVITDYDYPSTSKLDLNQTHFSLIRTKHFLQTSQVLEGKANWVVGGSGLKNNAGFSGAAFVNAREKTGDEISYYHFPIHFNDYVGITIPSKLSLGEPAPFSEEDGLKQNEMLGEQKSSAALVNIYQKGGPRSVDTLKSIYATTLSESYQQISPRMYWDNQVEGADPEISLETLRDVNGLITAFGGDCYLNSVFRKVFFNQFKDISSEMDVTNDNSKTNVGYTLGLIAESHLNAAVRSELQADVNESARRTFTPYGLSNSDSGDSYGEGNLMRKSRLLESDLLNKGYKAVNSLRNYFTISDDSSYVGSNWFSRILSSGRHIPNSFDNGYRNLSGVNFEDYNPELGSITRIMNFKDNLLAVFENGVIVIPINQRIQTGSDSGGAVFLEAQGVLSPAATPLSLDTGSVWHDSIITAGEAIYGIDSTEDQVWRFNGTDFIAVSRMRIDPTLKTVLESFKNSEKKFSKNIVAHFDGNKIIWSFIGKTGGNQTIAYDLVIQEFVGSTSVVPQLSFMLPGKFLSFNSGWDTFRFWEHNSEQVNYGSYYGRQFPFSISFVVNEEQDIQKVFDNLDIISNRVFPDTIVYKTQGTRTQQKISFDPRVMRLSNVNYNKNQVNVSIPPTEQVTNQSEYDFVDSFRANSMALIRKKSRQKGHAILIQLIYNSKSLVKINSVLTSYRDVK